MKTKIILIMTALLANSATELAQAANGFPSMGLRKHVRNDPDSGYNPVPVAPGPGPEPAPYEPIRKGTLTVSIYKHEFEKSPEGYYSNRVRLVCLKTVSVFLWGQREGRKARSVATDERDDFVQCDSTVTGIGAVDVYFNGSMSLSKVSLHEGDAYQTVKEYQAFLWATPKREPVLEPGPPALNPDLFKSAIASTKDLNLQSLALYVGGHELTATVDGEAPKESFSATAEFIDPGTTQK